jgi:NHLM bacteriocin system ABC transporter peptidase/ATP-binding protein
LVIPGIIAPVFSKLLVDNVLVRGLSGWIGPLLIGLMLTALLRAAILLIRQHYLLRLEVMLGVTMATRLFWHVLRLPIAFFTQRHAGDIVYRLIVNEQVAKLLSGELATLMLHLVTIGFFAAVMAAYDLTLAGVVVSIALINLAILHLVDRRRDEASRRLSQGRGQLAAATAGAIRSIESIKSSGLELDAFSRWAGYHAKAMNASQDLDRQTAGLAAVPPLLGALTNAAVLGIGSLRVMHGVMSIGDLVAFQTLAASFSEPIGRLVGLGAKLPEVKADLIRVSDAMAYPIDPRTEGWDDTASRTMPARLTGAIELRDVTFGYNPNEPPLISGFSLTVRPGQRIALVGGSGSGKSTVARLICGLYAPWSGAILFDGEPLADIPPTLFANSVAYVDQDVSMFSGTVRENVSLWDGSVDEARVARALKDAAIFDEIALRPGLYEYKVAEGGLDFSGGQRQRLEIARALVDAPTMLILDEATAALDPLVEEQIDANIRRRGCTCILVAHRYSTIRDCDEIVVLSNGRIEGRGTHAELLATCPHYVDLLQAE